MSGFTTKLGLGTVQFGLDYGISNTGGKPSEHSVREILLEAQKNGIQTLDTATLYGNSETVIGQALTSASPFKIVTKTPHFKQEIITPAQGIELEQTFHQSLKNLQVPRCYGLLIHAAADLLKPGAQYLVEAMRRIQAQGLVEKIGVSVYDRAQIEAVRSWFPFELVQVPASIFDQRLVRDGTFAEFARSGVEVHVRSAFLQGLLFMNPGTLPEFFSPARPALQRLADDASSSGLSKIELALHYLNAQTGVDRILCGVNSLTELSEIIASTRRSLPNSIDFSRYEIQNLDVLNPSRWPKRT